MFRVRFHNLPGSMNRSSGETTLRVFETMLHGSRAHLIEENAQCGKRLVMLDLLVFDGQ